MVFFYEFQGRLKTFLMLCDGNISLHNNSWILGMNAFEDPFYFEDNISIFLQQKKNYDIQILIRESIILE